MALSLALRCLVAPRTHATPAWCTSAYETGCDRPASALARGRFGFSNSVRDQGARCRAAGRWCGMWCITYIIVRWCCVFPQIQEPPLAPCPEPLHRAGSLQRRSRQTHKPQPNPESDVPTCISAAHLWRAASLKLDPRGEFATRPGWPDADAVYGCEGQQLDAHPWSDVVAQSRSEHGSHSLGGTHWGGGGTFLQLNSGQVGGLSTP